MSLLSSLSPAIGAVPTHLRERLWAGDTLVRARDSVATGFAVLDEQLPGGGWPTHGLTEVLAAGPGIGELRLVAPALAGVIRRGGTLVMMTPGPMPGVLPYPDGWAQLGIDPAALLLIDTATQADQLWAIEQALRSAACGAVLAWLPAIRPEALRRLQLAASHADGLSLLFRPAALRGDATPATLRLFTERTSGQGLAVHILKRRGPLLDRPVSIDLAEPRTWRTRAARRPTPLTEPASSPAHVVDRPPLPNPGSRLHAAPAA